MSETTEPGAALAILPQAQLPILLAGTEGQDILAALLRDLEGFEPDISTEKGRREIRSKAQKVRVAKADFDRLAGRLKDDAIKLQRGVNAEYKVIEARLDSLVERVRAPLSEYEEAEKARIKVNEEAIAALEALTVGLEHLNSDGIRALHDGIEQIVWSLEFKARGERVRDGVMARLKMAEQAALTREDEVRAEQQRVIAEAEEARKAAHRAAIRGLNDFALVPHGRQLTAVELRGRLDHLDSLPPRDWQEFAADADGMRNVVRNSILEWIADADAREAEAQRKHEEQIAHEAAEAARIAAEERAAVEAREASQRADAELARVEREKQEGLARERVAEGQRVAGHRNALARLADLGGDYSGQDTLRVLDVRLAEANRLALRGWQEFAMQAAGAHAETVRELETAIAAEQDRIRLANERAEATRIENEQKRAEAREAEAVETERQRVADAAAAQKIIDDKRSADRHHRAAINRLARTAIEKALDAVEGSSNDPAVRAQAVVEAIARGQVPNVTINYAAEAKMGALL